MRGRNILGSAYRLHAPFVAKMPTFLFFSTLPALRSSWSPLPLLEGSFCKLSSNNGPTREVTHKQESVALTAMSVSRFLDFRL